MYPFSISWINHNEREGVYLCFRANTALEMRLTLKEVCFIKANREVTPLKPNTIWPVFLSPENQDLLCFNYPKSSEKYQKVMFRIAQEGSKGWDVSVDLTSREILITEAKYQVL